MGRYTLTRDIAAPVAQVFTAFTDPAIAADWMDATGIQDVDGDLARQGASYTLVIRGPWRFRVRVARSEPPYVHETVHRGPLGTKVRMLATLEGHGARTRLTLLTEYTMPLGAIGRWLDRRYLERGPRTTANREVDRLVSLVTSAA